MQEKILTVQEYANHFGLIALSGYEEMKNRRIQLLPINRPGFELCGFFEATDKDRLVVIGTKESIYIKNAPKEQIIKAFEFLTNEKCPAIIICKGWECPFELLEIAKRKNFPVLTTKMSSSELNNMTFTYLNERLAPTTSIHASLIEIYSMGVLIMGESGIGKSETTLELIKKGHRLVADDRVNVSFVRNALYGECPELLAGVMEVRGIGIIDVKRLFGINSLLKKCRIAYAIRLVPYQKDEAYDRLGSNIEYIDILQHKIPVLNLPVSGARSMAEIIEVAVTNLKLKDDGYDSAFEFDTRMNELLMRKKRL